MTTAMFDDPLVSASGQFPLTAPPGTPPSDEIPSPIGLRPWGLRTLTEAAGRGTSTASPAHYDHDRQVAVDANGVPLITLGPPTANTTSSTDGEDPPSSEDWHNDFYPDEPFQA